MGLEIGGRGDTEKEEKEEEKEKEKIPHMCESIGHRPLRGRCPKSARIIHQRITIVYSHLISIFKLSTSKKISR